MILKVLGHTVAINRRGLIMQESKNRLSDSDISTKNPTPKADPDATSSDTLADLEANEKSSDSTDTTRSPSPDGAFDNDRSNSADGSDSGGPM
jgi:hypothetical protein